MNIVSKSPDFFIVGAAKAGTTSLWYYLNSNSNIYMLPIKEPHYFSTDIRLSNFRKDYRKKVEFDPDKYFSKPHLESRHIGFIEHEEDYVRLFRERKNSQIVGEASTGYLFSEVAAENIYASNPNSKIIIILRDPIERAFSHYLMNLKAGSTIYNNFLSEVYFDYSKKKKGWGISHLYVEIGLYCKQIEKYKKAFPNENLKIIILEDMVCSPESTISDIFSFLGIPYDKKLNFKKKHNASELPRSAIVPHLLKINSLFGINKIIPSDTRKKIRNLVYTTKNLPQLTNDDFIALKRIFIEDVLNLELLLDRELSWKSKLCR